MYNKIGDYMRIEIDDLLDVDLRNKVIIFQTDTVYGLGTSINNVEGVKRIYEIKKREPKKPLAILCADINQVKSIVENFDSGLLWAEKYWPGALTLIFRKNSLISDEITSGFDTVGVRIPNDEIALRILRKVGPMAVTSLNISSEPAILEFKQTIAFLRQVDYIVNGIDLNGTSSTVFDIANKKILRQGSLKI